MKRKKLYHKRLLFEFFMTMLMIDERMGLSETFTERRKHHVHMVGDRRRRWVEPVTHANTPRVTAVAIASVTLVITTSVIIGQSNPAMMMVIPAFSLYAAFVLIVRQVRLITQLAD
jgi:hypothetical protein